MINIKLYGADWCPDCRRAKSYLKEHNIKFEFIDVDLDKSATMLVEMINKGKRIIPTIFIGKKLYTNPENQILADALGINEVGRVILYGANWCPDCRRAKSYLRDNGILFQFIDVDEHEWATEEVAKINKGKRIIPTIIINNKPYSNPDNLVLQKVLGIDVQKETKVYDSIIIGGGAAGLTASIYAQRDRFDTLILEKKNIGGNAFLTEKIENYPGFSSISGPELMSKMEEHAKIYGATIKTGEEVVNIKKIADTFHIKTKTTTYIGRTAILATGSTYRTLGIPNESELIGAGVHFCATCDGAFYRDREIIVVGGGNSAIEESIFLSGFVKRIKIITNIDRLTATETYLEKLPSINNIEVLTNKNSIAFIASDDGLFKGLKVKDTVSGKVEIITADGAFIFIGLIPNTQLFKELIDLNQRGFIITKGMGQTSVKGIFAAGDCRAGAIAQVAAATGEGILSAYGIKDYLKG